MNSPRYSLLPVTVLALVLAGAGPAQAQSNVPQEPRSEPREQTTALEREQRRPSRRSSLSDAVRRVQRETGGQVLGAERVQFDGRDINRIKVMDDRGRVRYMDDDPQQRRGRERPDAPPARGDNPPPP